MPHELKRIFIEPRSIRELAKKANAHLLRSQEAASEPKPPRRFTNKRNDNRRIRGETPDPKIQNAQSNSPNLSLVKSPETSSAVSPASSQSPQQYRASKSPLSRPPSAVSLASSKSPKHSSASKSPLRKTPSAVSNHSSPIASSTPSRLNVSSPRSAKRATTTPKAQLQVNFVVARTSDLYLDVQPTSSPERTQALGIFSELEEAGIIEFVSEDSSLRVYKNNEEEITNANAGKVLWFDGSFSNHGTKVISRSFSRDQAIDAYAEALRDNSFEMWSFMIDLQEKAKRKSLSVDAIVREFTQKNENFKVNVPDLITRWLENLSPASNWNPNKEDFDNLFYVINHNFTINDVALFSQSARKMHLKNQASFNTEGEYFKTIAHCLCNFGTKIAIANNIDKSVFKDNDYKPDFNTILVNEKTLFAQIQDQRVTHPTGGCTYVKGKDSKWCMLELKEG